MGSGIDRFPPAVELSEVEDAEVVLLVDRDRTVGLETELDRLVGGLGGVGAGGLILLIAAHRAEESIKKC